MGLTGTAAAAFDSFLITRRETIQWHTELRMKHARVVYPADTSPNLGITSALSTMFVIAATMEAIERKTVF